MHTLGEGNRKSPSALHGDFFLHSISAADTEPCNGTGLQLASVLQSPNRPRTQDRVTGISRVKEFTSLHRSANNSDRSKKAELAAQRTQTYQCIHYGLGAEEVELRVGCSGIVLDEIAVDGCLFGGITAPGG